jgi:xanthine dehydrogenase accessory factor
MKPDDLVVIRGGGDLGTGVAHRLHRAGYSVLILEVERPTAVRRRVAFAQAILDGEAAVEGVTARRTTLAKIEDAVRGTVETGGPDGVWTEWIPVLVDADGEAIDRLGVRAIIDARMLKRRTGSPRDGASVTVGLGPGFVAGRDVDLVIETARGHSLGRVIETGAAEPNTGVPGDVGGAGAERVIRSSAEGLFEGTRAIGDIVEAGDVVGVAAGVPARARIGGLLRGIVADGTAVAAGQKLGDVDPRGPSVDPEKISDKARAVGGGVLEGLLRMGVLPNRFRGAQ